MLFTSSDKEVRKYYEQKMKYTIQMEKKLGDMHRTRKYIKTKYVEENQ